MGRTLPARQSNLSELGIVPIEETSTPAPVLRAGVESSLNESGMMLHEEGVFTSLWSNVRDVFFPVKLPPLVLESKPIAVVDKMATKQDPRATAASVAIYALLILLIAWMVKQKVQFSALQKQVAVTDLTAPPPMAPQKATVMGGGGGQRNPTPVTKGHLPKFAEQQITPPKIPVEEKVQMPEPTIEVQKNVKMANNAMPNIGMPTSPLVGASMGNGSGSGLGSGNGSGLGAGSGGNYGGGVKQIGGGVSAPVVI